MHGMLVQLPPCLGPAICYSLTSPFSSRPLSWPLVTTCLSLTLEKTTVVMKVREANPGLGFRISSCPHSDSQPSLCLQTTLLISWSFWEISPQLLPSQAAIHGSSSTAGVGTK